VMRHAPKKINLHLKAEGPSRNVIGAEMRNDGLKCQNTVRRGVVRNQGIYKSLGGRIGFKPLVGKDRTGETAVAGRGQEKKWATRVVH